MSYRPDAETSLWKAPEVSTAAAPVEVVDWLLAAAAEVVASVVSVLAGSAVEGSAVAFSGEPGCVWSCSVGDFASVAQGASAAAEGSVEGPSVGLADLVGSEGLGASGAAGSGEVGASSILLVLIHLRWEGGGKGVL